MSTHMMQQPREQRVAEYIERVVRDQEFPALTEQIRDLMAVLESEDRSMQHLANIVLRDYALTLKVVRVANSFQYNRAGTPILSITHAMVLLGVQAVRDLAAGVLLMEHFQQNSSAVKQLVLLSMLTAAQSRDIARQVGYGRPEEAYLCGMFRNVGEMVVACHAPEDYGRILAHARDTQRSLADAAASVLSFRFEDIGAALASFWNMPAPVAASIRPQLGSRDPLVTITAFSHELATTVYRTDTPPDEQRVSALVRKYGSSLDLDPKRVRDVLEEGVRETRESFKHLHVSFDDLRLRRQIETALTELAPENVSLTEDAPAEVEPEISDAAEVGERLLAEISEAVNKGTAADLNRTLLMVLEAMLRLGRFDRVAFGLVSPDRKELRGRFGLGDGIDKLIDRLKIDLQPPAGPIAVGLAGGRDVALPSRPGQVAPREAAALAALGCASCALYPVVVLDRLVGCLYGDRLSEAGEAEQPTAAVFLTRLRDLTTRAFARNRETPAPAAAAEPVIPVEEKHRAVMQLLQGTSPVVVSRALRVSVDEVNRWKATFLAGALDALSKGPRSS